MPDIDLGFAAPVAIILLMVFVGVAAAILFYRYTLPPVPPRIRSTLATLRGISLSLLLMLLAEPMLRLGTKIVEQPLLAVLIDNSRSMSIVDRGGRRDDRLRSIIGDTRPHSLSTLPGARFFTFGQRFRESSLDSLEIPDSLFSTEEATNMANALEQLHRLQEKEPIRAALIITDGAYTEGINPLYPAEALGIPVSTIGIGDSVEQRDVVVLRVTTNDLVYAGTEVPVDVTIKSAGFDGERVDVSLSDGRSILNHRTIQLAPGTHEYTVHLAYTPTGEGPRKYRVHVSSIPQELTTDNNSRDFFVKILKGKLRVLILSGAPSPDVAILKETLNEDPNLTAQSFSQKRDGGWYEGRLGRPTLDSADCIITIGFPTARTPRDVLGDVSGMLVEKSTPLLFIWSPGIDLQRLGEISSVLPFSVASVSGSTRFVFAEPVQAFSANPIIALDDGSRIDRWRKLPPIFQTEMDFRPKAEARTIAVCKVQNVVTTDPLLLLRHVSRKKCVAVAGYGLWRWRLMAQDSPETADLLSLFLSNTVRWLTTREDDKRVKIVPDRQTVLQGDPIDFTGQVYDANARPVSDARVAVTITGEKNEFEVDLQPAGNGLYKGSIDGLPGGDYSFTGTAQANNSSLGEDKGRFVVGERNVEFQDTRMNVSLLRQIAARTGGTFALPDSLPVVLERIQSQPTFTSFTTHKFSDYELWNWPYVLAALVLLLALEWVLRKRYGML